MVESRWINGDERRQVASFYAKRLWDARDRISVSNGRVAFEDFLYLEVEFEGNEAERANALLVDGPKTYRMIATNDPLTVAVDALIAWKILRQLEGEKLRLPDRIEIAPAPVVEPAVPERPSLRRELAKMLGISSRTHVKPAPPVVIEDPMVIARYELGRRVHALIVENRLMREWRAERMRIVPRLWLSVGRMTLDSIDHGETRIHPSWRGPLNAAISANCSSDLKWTAARDADAAKASCYDGQEC